MVVMNISADKNRKRKKQIQEHTLVRGNTGLTQGEPWLHWVPGLILPNPDHCWGSRNPRGQSGTVPRNISPRASPSRAAFPMCWEGTRNSFSPRERL